MSVIVCLTAKGRLHDSTITVGNTNYCAEK